VSPNDALIADNGKRFDYVPANPPLGKKSRMTFTNEEGEQEKDDLVYNRQDFWATTANVLFFDNQSAAKAPWTKAIWYYDYRTNVHHTLKRKPMRFENLAEFIANYIPANRHARKETWRAETNPDGRWRRYTYDEIIGRDKTSLDLFWLKDRSLADLDNLPEPGDLAEDIIENIEAGLNNFRTVLASLGK